MNRKDALFIIEQTVKALRGIILSLGYSELMRIIYVYIRI